MVKWLVELIGESIDLQCAYTVFHNNEPEVINEDGKYFLRTKEFDGLLNAENVRNRAKEIIKFLSDTIYLQYRDSRPIKGGQIISIDENGKRSFYLFAEGEIQLRGVVSNLLNSNTTPPIQENQAVHFYRIASDNVVVADVLAFFSRGDWINLYKVFELIRDEVGGKEHLITKKWVNKKDLTRFTMTAQSRKSIGDQARHASENFPPHPNPMSLHEARVVIGNLVDSWIKSYSSK